MTGLGSCSTLATASTPISPRRRSDLVSQAALSVVGPSQRIADVSASVSVSMAKTEPVGFNQSTMGGLGRQGAGNTGILSTFQIRPPSVVDTKTFGCSDPRPGL